MVVVVVDRHAVAKELDDNNHRHNHCFDFSDRATVVHRRRTNFERDSLGETREKERSIGSGPYFHWA